jgi:hypothetical protein
MEADAEEGAKKHKKAHQKHKRLKKGEDWGKMT